MKAVIYGLAILAGAMLGLGHAKSSAQNSSFGFRHDPVRVAEVKSALAQEPEEEPLPEIDPTELMYLASLIHAEAGNQDLWGKLLVGSVVLNRMADPSYPDTLHGVIYQRGQFSVAWNGMLDRALDGERSAEDIDAAAQLLRYGPVDGRPIFFRTGRYSDYGTPLYKHGTHYFSE